MANANTNPNPPTKAGSQRAEVLAEASTTAAPAGAERAASLREFVRNPGQSAVGASGPAKSFPRRNDAADADDAPNLKTRAESPAVKSRSGVAADGTGPAAASSETASVTSAAPISQAAEPAAQGLFGGLIPAGVSSASAILAGGGGLLLLAGGGGGGGTSTSTNNPPSTPASPPSAPETGELTVKNNAPVAALERLAVKDNQAAVAGRLNATDVDQDSLSYALAQPVSGFTLNPDGSYRFDPAVLRSLKAGESRELRAEYSVTDAKGASTSSALVILVEGQNEQPSVSPTNRLLNQGETVSGRIPATDPDGDSLTYRAMQGQIGFEGLSFSQDGSYSFSATAGQYLGLAAGETKTLSFRFSVSDGKTEVPGSLAFTVKGLNDAPTGLTEAEAGNGVFELVDDDTIVSGQLFASDADPADAQKLKFILTGSGNAGFTVTPDGQFEFDPSSYFADASYASIGDGEIFRVLALTYRAVDPSGLQSTDLKYEFRLLGINDAPVIDPLRTTNASDLFERADNSPSENSGNIAVSGSIVSSDPDRGDAISFRLVEGVRDLNGSLITQALGTFSLAAATAGSSAANWTYSVAANSLNPLAAGQSQVQIYTVEITDRLGAIVRQDIRINLRGANDAPVANSLLVERQALSATSNFTLSGIDEDNGETTGLRYELVNPGAAPAGLIVRNDGSCSLDTSSYVALGQGSVREFVLAYRVVDAQGSASAPVNLTLRVVGTNDAPSVAASVSLSAKETDPNLTGRLSASDIDTGETATLVFSTKGLVPSGFSLASDGRYSLDLSQYDYLSQGQRLPIVVEYFATDVHGSKSNSGQLVISIEGQNDIPIVASVQAVGEGISVMASDIDRNDQLEFVLGSGTSAVRSLFSTTGGLFLAEQQLTAITGLLMITDSFDMVSTGLWVGLGSGDADSLSASDVAALYGFAGNDTLTGGTLADFISGGEGNDLIAGQAGQDTLDGGAGSDTVSYAGETMGVTVDLADMTNVAGDILIGFENVFGSSGGDILSGDAVANLLSGDSGADRLDGREGNDSLSGGAGTDTLHGGTSADLMSGGADADVFGFNNLGAAGQSLSATGQGGLGFGAFLQFSNGLDEISDFSSVDRLDSAPQVSVFGPSLFTASSTLQANTVYVAYGQWDAVSKTFTFSGQTLGGTYDALVVVGEGGAAASATGYTLLHDLRSALGSGNFI